MYSHCKPIHTLRRALFLPGPGFLYFLASVTACLAFPATAQIEFQPTTYVNPGAAVDFPVNLSIKDRHPYIENDGGSTWIAVWAGANRGNIQFSVSRDAGATWAPNKVLAPEFAKLNFRNTFPKIATDNQGRWVIVWTIYRQYGVPTDEDRDIVASTSLDNGVTWSYPVFVNSYATTDIRGDFTPDLATDGNGLWAVVWESRGSPDVEPFQQFGSVLLSTSTDNGLTWSPITNLGGAGERYKLPRIETAPGEPWIVIWHQAGNEQIGSVGNSQDIVLRRSFDGTATWSDPILVHPNDDIERTDEYDPYLVHSTGNEWRLVWSSWKRHIYTSKSLDSGATWDEPVPLDTPRRSIEVIRSNRLPTMVTDGQGNWVVQWSAEDSYSRVFGGCCPAPTPTFTYTLTTSSQDNGETWAPDTPFFEMTGYTKTVSTNGLGEWILSWADDNVTAIRSNDAGQTWGETFGIDTPLDWSTYSDNGAVAASDNAGTTLVVWRSLEPESEDQRGWYATRSFDHGATWRDPELIIPDTTSTFIQRQDLYFDGTDTWIFIYHTRIDNLTTYFFITSNDYGYTWSTPKPLVGDLNTGDNDVTLAFDQFGNWIAIWTDTFAENIDVERISFSKSYDGGATWTPRKIIDPHWTTFYGDERREVLFGTTVAASPHGTMISAWSDGNEIADVYDLGTDSDIIYARSIDGGDTWQLQGPLNTSAGDDSATQDKRAVGDDSVKTQYLGNNKWIAVWQSTLISTHRDNQFPDIICAISTDDGLTWSDPAPVNSDAASTEARVNNTSPQLAVTPEGEIVVTWERSLLGSEGLYYATSDDAGLTWSDFRLVSGVLPSYNGYIEGHSLLHSGSGNIISVSSSSDSLDDTLGSDYDILTATTLKPYEFTPDSVFIQGGGALRLR